MSKKSSMSKKTSEGGNQGIIARTVTGELVVSGQNATAIQNRFSIDIHEFRATVSELRTALEALKLPDNARLALSEHVSQLEHEATNFSPDRGRVEGALKALSSSVKMLGEFISNASIILTPIAKIAAIFGLTLF